MAQPNFLMTQVEPSRDISDGKVSLGTHSLTSQVEVIP